MTVILITANFAPIWENEFTGLVTPEQVQASVLRIGAILLIIGLLHGVNIVLMPVLGRQLPVEREQPAQHGHEHDVDAVQGADDEQDAAHPQRSAPQLFAAHQTGELVVPRRPGGEARGHQDVGREDQVVDDVGQHDVALAGQRVVVEDIGGVGAAEPLDERALSLIHI